MQRSFSFQSRDDDPNYHPLPQNHPDAHDDLPKNIPPLPITNTHRDRADIPQQSHQLSSESDWEEVHHLQNRSANTRGSNPNSSPELLSASDSSEVPRASPSVARKPVAGSTPAVTPAATETSNMAYRDHYGGGGGGGDPRYWQQQEQYGQHQQGYGYSPQPPSHQHQQQGGYYDPTPPPQAAGMTAPYGIGPHGEPYGGGGYAGEQYTQYPPQNNPPHGPYDGYDSGNGGYYQNTNTSGPFGDSARIEPSASRRHGSRTVPGPSGAAAAGTAAAAGAASLAPHARSLHSNSSGGSGTRTPDRGGPRYTDSPYNRNSAAWDPVLVKAGFASPLDIGTDDEDDTFQTQRNRLGVTAGAASGSAVAVGAGGAARGQPPESEELMAANVIREKNEFLRSEAARKKKVKWIILIGMILIVAAIVAGTSAGVILSKKSGSSDSSSDSSSASTSSSNPSGVKGGANGGGGIDITAAQDLKLNGDLNANSPAIKKLMSNPNLHKVFHGIDYTPLGTVYPECLKWPPSQNNITRDLAVMSQLTDKIRLYGNDCNQTEMVFYAIDQLKIDMKVWIGVWLDGNSTTNTRQIAELWNIMSQEKHHDKIEGIAVGNEVLFAKTISQWQLMQHIKDVKTNLTSLGLGSIPVGTSDLGSNWDATMAGGVDVLMANVHPFFAGVTVDKAAEWTYDFFVENDVSVTKGLSKAPRVMISEVGWPSDGGEKGGSVAGVEELNKFMEDFVCKENKRGTEYFWFSAFDEPWKVRYNVPENGEEWEDKWGLMDVNRNLKKGLKIPECK